MTRSGRVAALVRAVMVATRDRVATQAIQARAVLVATAEEEDAS
jgi:hypothetical protein